MEVIDVVIIGAGAAGLLCAIEAAKRKRNVLVLDHANKAGKKILMSGGGRCNFTNYMVSHEKFISNNPHFCKSALSRYTQWDFLQLVKQYQIPFHEKIDGQLFCDNKSKDIVEMLLSECQRFGATIRLNTTIEQFKQLTNQEFTLKTKTGNIQCQSLVIATGGLSIPTMGASPFGYQVAKQFGLKVWPTCAGLVPVTLQQHDKDRFAILSGISVDSVVSNSRQSFRGNILFTHRGLSGPAILQMSSYWMPGEELNIDLLPDMDLLDHLITLQAQGSQQQLKSILATLLPKRVVSIFLDDAIGHQSLQSISHKQFKQIVSTIQAWTIKPNGTEGYRTAEVTLGGVDCDAISSKTMAVKHVPGLYFIGEVLDVTGWLGGYNFQWAWSSGWAAGQVV